MHIDKVDFGAIVKRCRKNKGYTQEELGELIGLGPRQIATIENEGGKTKFENLEKILRVLSIPAEAIFQPEAMSRTLEQEQAISDFLRCSAGEQRIITATMRCMIKEMRGAAPEGKNNK